MKDLEEQVNVIHRSTRTWLPIFVRVHNWFRMNHRWYYRWHLFPYATHVHVATLGLAFLMVISSVLTVNVQLAHAATATWDGGGGDNNWSTCANWSSDTCPVAGDAVVFNSTSTKDSTVDAGFTSTVGTLTISSGYTGTITLATSFRTTSNFSQAAGTFNASSQTLTIDGSFTLSAGVFTASSGTTTVAGSWTISGSSTFNHNSGTFASAAAGSVTLSCNNVSFNLVTITNSSSTTTISSNCNLPLGNNPTLGGASSTSVAGVLSGTGTLTKSAGTLTITTTSATSTTPLSGFSAVSLVAFTINGATTTVDMSSYTSAAFAGTFTLTNGTFTAPTGGNTFSLGGSLTVSAGTFTVGSTSIMTIGTANGATINCNSLVTFASGSRVVINHGTNNVKTIQNCTLPLGASPTVSGSVTLGANGVLSGTGTLAQTGTSAILILNGSGASLSGFSAMTTVGFTWTNGTIDSSMTSLTQATGTMTVNGGTANFGNFTTFSVNNLTYSSGNLTMPSGTATINGAITFSGAGTFSANGGTISFEGGSSTLSCNSVTFNRVIFNNDGGTKTVSSNCSMPLGADPTMSGTSGVTVNGTISGTGTLTKTTTGTLTLASTSPLSGFSGLNVNALTISTASTVVDLSSYTTATITSLTVNAGTVTAPTAGMTVSTFALAGGTFTAPSGTLTISANLTASGTPTFTANGGTVNFTGSGNVTCVSGMTFNLVTFNNTGARTVNSLCSLPLGSNPTLASSVVNNGVLSGTGTLRANSTLTLNNTSAAALSGFSGLTVNGSFNITGGTVDFGSYSTVDLNGAVNLTAGSWTAPSGTMTIAGGFSITGTPTFNANGGTITFDGVSATLTCNNVTFNRVTFNLPDSGVAKTVASSCNLPLGDNPTMGNRIILNGQLTGTGTLSLSFLTMNSGSVLSGFTGLVTTHNFTVDGPTIDFSNYTNVNLGSLIIQSGTVTAPPGTMYIAKSFNNSGGTFNHNNGTVELNGPGNQSVIGNNTFYNLTKKASSSVSLLFSADAIQTILGALTLTGG